MTDLLDQFPALANGAQVTREECSQTAWEMLGYRARRIEELENEILQLHKRLCKYEGHLVIHDPDGKTWCEMCQSEVKV